MRSLTQATSKTGVTGVTGVTRVTRVTRIYNLLKILDFFNVTPYPRSTNPACNAAEACNSYRTTSPLLAAALPDTLRWGSTLGTGRGVSK